MVPLSLMEGEEEERRNGETKVATDSISLLRVIQHIRTNVFTVYRLQYLEFLVRRRSISFVRRSTIPRVGRSCGGLLTM